MIDVLLWTLFGFMTQCLHDTGTHDVMSHAIVFACHLRSYRLIPQDVWLQARACLYFIPTISNTLGNSGASGTRACRSASAEHFVRVESRRRRARARLHFKLVVELLLSLDVGLVLLAEHLVGELVLGRHFLLLVLILFYAVGLYRQIIENQAAPRRTCRLRCRAAACTVLTRQAKCNIGKLQRKRPHLTANGLNRGRAVL